jgi:hypothetical protein
MSIVVKLARKDGGEIDSNSVASPDRIEFHSDTNNNLKSSTKPEIAQVGSYHAHVFSFILSTRKDSETEENPNSHHYWR